MFALGFLCFHVYLLPIDWWGKGVFQDGGFLVCRAVVRTSGLQAITCHRVRCFIIKQHLNQAGQLPGYPFPQLCSTTPVGPYPRKLLFIPLGGPIPADLSDKLQTEAIPVCPRPLIRGQLLGVSRKVFLESVPSIALS